MMNTAKLLMLQYDFKSAIPLTQAVKDYFNAELSEREIVRKANKGEFPFPVYKSDPTNRKSGWFVNLESLASWLGNKAKQAQKDYQNIHH